MKHTIQLPHIAILAAFALSRFGVRSDSGITGSRTNKPGVTALPKTAVIMPARTGGLKVAGRLLLCFLLPTPYSLLLNVSSI